MALFKKKIHYLLLSLSVGVTANAQIVNIERARMQSDTIGWLGSAGASFTLNKNTRQVFSADADVHLQYKSKKSLYLVLVNYGFLKGGDQKLIDYGFIHLRYNYKINKSLRWEIFTQLQNNVITRISSRYLAGTGPRFKIVSNKKIHFYAASLVMLERELELGNNILHRDVRNSSYVSFTFMPTPTLQIISTSFFQPLFNQFKDHRFLNQTSIKIKASEHFGVSINWNYLKDQFPVKGIPNENYTLSTGFIYEF